MNDLIVEAAGVKEEVREVREEKRRVGWMDGMYSQDRSSSFSGSITDSPQTISSTPSPASNVVGYFLNFPLKFCILSVNNRSTRWSRDTTVHSPFNEEWLLMMIHSHRFEIISMIFLIPLLQLHSRSGKLLLQLTKSMEEMLRSWFTHFF